MLGQQKQTGEWAALFLLPSSLPKRVDSVLLVWGGGTAQRPSSERLNLGATPPPSLQAHLPWKLLPTLKSSDPYPC